MRRMTHIGRYHPFTRGPTLSEAGWIRGQQRILALVLELAGGYRWARQTLQAETDQGGERHRRR